VQSIGDKPVDLRQLGYVAQVNPHRTGGIPSVVSQRIELTFVPAKGNNAPTIFCEEQCRGTAYSATCTSNDGDIISHTFSETQNLRVGGKNISEFGNLSNTKIDEEPVHFCRKKALPVRKRLKHLPAAY
jgi:hypothetical protein